jgi:hypothetical protein
MPPGLAFGTGAADAADAFLFAFGTVTVAQD